MVDGEIASHVHNMEVRRTYLSVISLVLARQKPRVEIFSYLAVVIKCQISGAFNVSDTLISKELHQPLKSLNH